jgi:flagellar assembly factor FliW
MVGEPLNTRMLRCASENFGVVEYDSSSVIAFPRGLPGFESERLFVPVERDGSNPLLFLQSVITPRLCFITIPVESVDPGYQLRVSDEDLGVIGVDAGQTASLRCLAVVCTSQDQPTANLLGPLVINPENRQAVQAVRDDAQYSVQHPLFPREENSGCS